MRSLEKLIFVLSVIGVILTTVFAWFLLYWQAAPVRF